MNAVRLVQVSFLDVALADCLIARSHKQVLTALRDVVGCKWKITIFQNGQSEFLISIKDSIAW